MTLQSLPVIGLIGAIGAGKSVAARILATHGGAIVDADVAGHEVLERIDVKSQLVSRWKKVRDEQGRIDRKAVAAIVFDNPREKQFLEQLVFPHIRRECEQRIEALQAARTCDFIVLDAPLMLEASWIGITNHILFIDAPLELREERVHARNGWTPADLAAREAGQLSNDIKKTAANAVIVNDGTLEQLEAKIVRFLREHVKGPV
jgi:dephospho-CoA kinase